MNKMPTEIANTYDHLRDLIKKAKTHVSQGNCSHEFWCRGHDRGSYRLTPSLFRYETPEEKELLMFEIWDHNVKDTEYGHDPWSKHSNTDRSG